MKTLLNSGYFTGSRIRVFPTPLSAHIQKVLIWFLWPPKQLFVLWHTPFNDNVEQEACRGYHQPNSGKVIRKIELWETKYIQSGLYLDRMMCTITSPISPSEDQDDPLEKADNHWKHIFESRHGRTKTIFWGSPKTLQKTRIYIISPTIAIHTYKKYLNPSVDQVKSKNHTRRLFGPWSINICNICIMYIKLSSIHLVPSPFKQCEKIIHHELYI
jgi:hypothetical protein